MDEVKISSVKHWLKADLQSADIKWSLFYAAVQSYRHDTVLRPFPTSFMKGDGDDPLHKVKEHKRLVKVCEEMPDLMRVSRDMSALSGDLLDVLHWVLQPRTLKLKTCEKEKFSEIKAKTGQVGPAPVPNYIFEVEYNSCQRDKFDALRGSRNIFYAYHGSRVENFHSILHNGLVHHMNKNGLFGEGTYLSAELSITMPYAPCGCGWKHSCLGESLSCVAVCEIIDDNAVKCLVKDDRDNVHKKRSQIKDSMGGAVPEKYYVIRNDEILRVKYLLVYATKRARPRTSAQWRWASQHRFTIMMVLYVILLIVIGFCSSSSFKNLLRKKFAR